MRALPSNIHGVEPALLHAELDKLDALTVVKGPAKVDAKFNGGTPGEEVLPRKLTSCTSC